MRRDLICEANVVVIKIDCQGTHAGTSHEVLGLYKAVAALLALAEQSAKDGSVNGEQALDQLTMEYGCDIR